MKRTKIKIGKQRVVRRRFTIHKSLGLWMVRMADGDGNNGRMLCLCTRKPDAYYISALLNRPTED